jgi:hypothetical protein
MCDCLCHSPGYKLEEERKIKEEMSSPEAIARRHTLAVMAASMMTLAPTSDKAIDWAVEILEKIEFRERNSIR